MKALLWAGTFAVGLTFGLAAGLWLHLYTVTVINKNEGLLRVNHLTGTTWVYGPNTHLQWVKINEPWTPPKHDKIIDATNALLDFATSRPPTNSSSGTH